MAGFGGLVMIDLKDHDIDAHRRLANELVRRVDPERVYVIVQSSRSSSVTISGDS